MFTPRAKQTLKLAEEAARQLGHPCVGSHHLLLGFFVLGEGGHFFILRSLGITHDSLFNSVGDVGPVDEPTETVDGFVLGLSAAAALRRAERGANALGHAYVGLEHILMSLLSEKSGGAARIFAAHRIDTVAARRSLIRECSWSIPKGEGE